MNEQYGNSNNNTNQGNSGMANQPLNNDLNINSTYSQPQSNVNMPNQINNQQYSIAQQQNYQNQNLNQQFNQQNINQNNSYQQQVQPNHNNQNLGINPKKKSKIGIVVFVIIALIVILGVVILISKNKVQSTTNNSNSVGNIYSNYTEDYPIENRNIEYYWNINTEAYDSTKFDGSISFFGNIITTKITGKTLFENGYTIIDPPSSYSYSKNFFGNRPVNNTYDYRLKSGYIQKESQKFPDESRVADTLALPKFINFGDDISYYTDETEFYYEYNKTDKSDVNVVFPSLNGTAYENLTIDYIIEKMGVPTYVASGDTLIPTVRNDDNSENIMTFNYYYEYSDYTFVFHFMGFNQKLTGVTYIGMQTFNHSFYDNEFTLKEILKNAQNEYLQNIK